MDSPTPHISSPFVALSHLAAAQGEMPGAAVSPVTSAPHTEVDETTQLRARLLQMIVDQEHFRKAASAEAFNAR